MDVAIVGFGPAAQVLTSLLGRAGHRIVVLEKFAVPYGLPRMSTLDGEVARLLQHTCDAAKALAGAIPQPRVELFGADGALAATIDWDYVRGGYPSHLSLHQPNLEAAMIERIATFPNVEVCWGREVTAIEQVNGEWAITATGPSGAERVRACYLVGLDGASSFVRRALGIEMDVLHVHDERWVLTDFDVLSPLPNGLDHRIYIDMHPAQPYFYGPNGRNRCRTDVRLRPGDDPDAVLTEELAYEFLERRVGISRDLVKITRRVLYQFRSQIARAMRVGNAFIGGDAAHPMTPYMAQGACTAMRDAANLAWKLDLVLRGKVSATLLDTYESERLEHGAQFVRGSLSAWAMINTANEENAPARDQALRALGVVPTRIAPLRNGILQRKSNGAFGIEAGELAPQGLVSMGGREGLLDDLLGFGFQLVSTLELDEALGERRIARLDEIGMRRVTLGSADQSGRAVPLDSSYIGYFAKHGVTTMCSRPDLYIFGLASGVSESVALIDELLAALGPRPIQPSRAKSSGERSLR